MAAVAAPSAIAATPPLAKNVTAVLSAANVAHDVQHRLTLKILTVAVDR